MEKMTLKVTVEPVEGSEFWCSQKFEGTLQGANQFLTIGQKYECQILSPGCYNKHYVTLSTNAGEGVGKVSYRFRYDLEKDVPVSILQEGRDAIESDLDSFKLLGKMDPVRTATLRLLDALLVQESNRIADDFLAKLMTDLQDNKVGQNF